MLGWEILVTPKSDDKRLLASWKVGLGGTAWLDELAKKGLAKDLGGDGYPIRYEVSAGTLTSVLERGVPKHGGPTVIGDDYVHPGDWTGDVRIDLVSLRSLDPQELLDVEAWDQS